MTLSEIQTLFDYNYWAKNRIDGVLATLTTEQLTKNLGSSHGGIFGTLYHMMGAEEVWFCRWKGESLPSYRKPEDFPTLENLDSHWKMVEMEIEGYLHTLKSDDDIARTFSYKDLKGNPHTNILWHTMQHLVNHGSFHRGQIVAMLRQLGVKPVSTDLIAFYREKR